MSKYVVRTLVIAAAVTTLGAAVAGAQDFSYYTTGYFSNAAGAASCGGPAPGSGAPGGTSTATCTTALSGGGSMNLTFTGAGTAGSPVTLAAPTFAELGDFNLRATGSGSFSTGDVLFTLVLHQTAPTAGMDIATGSITGSVTMRNSLLIWQPTNAMLNVDPVTYEILLGVIPRGGLGVPIPLGTSTIEGFVTSSSVVPEPATVLLLGSGLAGLGLVGLRNRRRARVTA